MEKRKVILGGRRNKPWTTAEIQILIAIVREADLKNYPLSYAFKRASRELGRTIRSCETRWHNKLKFKLKQDGVIFRNEKFLATKNRTKMEKNGAANNQPKPTQKQVAAPQTANKPKQNKTKLSMLLESYKTYQSEDFKILKSGKGKQDEFVVVNNEGEYGYYVKAEDGKVVSCNCPHRTFRAAACKHMIKVALENDLEIDLS